MSLVALTLGIIFITWLIRRDIATRGHMAPQLWIPLIWLLIYGSRPLAHWFGGAGGGGSELEGSKIDAFVVFMLIFSAFVVLSRRNFKLSQLASLNVAFALFFAYYVLSSVWSPFPFVTLKRLFKEYGHLLVILVILTDKDPVRAMKLLYVRCAYVLLPLSVILYRWFPHYGRNYSNGGFATVTGVTPQKNSLGQICAFLCLVLVWDIVETKRQYPAAIARAHNRPKWVVLIIGLTLLVLCNSMTSFLAFLVGLAIYLGTYLGMVRRSATFFAKACFVGVSATLAVAAVWTLAIAPVLEALGRDPTFTERTRIWTAVLEQKKNVFVGSGFFSFWITPEGRAVQDTFVNFVPRSSHNGYLETYLDGGWIGCALLFCFLVVTGMRLANAYSHANDYARVLFAMLIMALIINFAEACVFRLNILWLSVLMAALVSGMPLLRDYRAKEPQA